jgi:hypothetical protein
VWREDISLESICEKPYAHGLDPICAQYFKADFSPLSDPWAHLQTFRDILSQYVSRHLSHSSDLLIAFAGISEMLVPRLGPFYWGFPARHFVKCIGWRFNGQFLSRRTDGPSWSWVGWHWSSGPPYASRSMDRLNVMAQPLFEIRSWGQPDLVLSSNSDEVHIHGAVRKLSSHPHFITDNEQILPDNNVLTAIPVQISHLIAFFTSSSMLSISDFEPRENDRYRTGMYEIRNPADDIKWTRLFDIHLEDAWIFQRPRLQEFIVLYAWYDETVCLQLMLIEWVNGIAYRVQLAHHGVLAKDWFRTNPQRKLIILG